ncbi:MAG: nucleotidyltransferase family protein [Bradymonadales bacterium]|nr:nucleotidyltransferase family protein [Bradymonadales bacterium]
MSITAILLAGGSSLRMGVDKLSLPWDEGTVLDAALRPLVDLAEIDEVVVVVRGDRGPVFRPGRASVVVNDQAEEGMGSSLKVGVEAADPTSEAYILALGDMPLLRSALVAQLIAAWRAIGKGILVPVFEGRRGHPVVLSGKYREALLASSGDVGARHLVARNEQDTVYYQVADPAVVADLDTPEGYQAMAARGLAQCED